MKQLNLSPQLVNPQITELTDLESMLKMLPLLQQLNPTMTEARYHALLEAMIAQGNYFQVACLDNSRCLGLTGVWIGTQLWCGKFIELDNFIVDEAFRNQGIGQRLVAWVEERARKEACEMIRLNSYVTLEKAHRFYFARGFRIEGFHMTKRLEKTLK